MIVSVFWRKMKHKMKMNFKFEIKTSNQKKQDQCKAEERRRIMSVKKYVEWIRNNHLIEIAVLAVILMSTMFSSCYIAEEINHDCSGASCPICMMIRQCEDNLRQIGGSQLAVAAIAAGICFFCQMNSSIRTDVSFETLVTRKVRLND